MLYFVGGYLVCGCVFVAVMMWKVSQDEEMIDYINQVYEGYRGWMSLEGFIFAMILVGALCWLPTILASFPKKD